MRLRIDAERQSAFMRPVGRMLTPVLIGGAMLLGVSHSSHASLALIRQGAESRGSRESGDLHGRSLAAGDFNSDGIDDLAVGAPFEDVSGVGGAGAVVVSYGNEFGLRHTGAQLLLQSDGDALEFSASFGWSLAAGDFDDDGYDDLAVGAPTADAGGITNAGLVFVYADGPGGLSYWHYLWQPAGGGSVEANDRFGASLCVGNFDGFAGTNEDLAVGSPGEDSDAGAVFYFTGGSNGLLNGSSGWRKQSTFGGTNVAGDQFGYSLAAAHVWGGPQDELIVGTPFKEVAGIDDAGIVWVILGTTTGPSATSAESIEPDEDDLVNQPYPDGYFGWAVAGGRFFGGSFDGVAIGEPGRSYFGNPESGRVVVGKGSTLGLNFSGANAIALFQNDAGWALGPDDGFGRALAAGFYDTSDGYEDLAIGSPTDNANGGPFGAGVVSVLFGGTNGPGSHGWVGWAEDAWRDDIEANDQFAASLVFGRFDGTDKGNLAIGAPGEDANTGMVCISAPWRQQQFPGYRNALAIDCEGNWIYALRPYDEVYIASTTKIMTVLIGCERAALPIDHPLHVNFGLTYQVPDWIREHIGGSRYHFKDEQRLSGFDLLRCCLYPSGNDAAYALADLMTGGLSGGWGGSYDNTCQLFVAEMNARAEELGMTRTHFTNPAGLDKGGPKSCARDMVVLAQAAMDNSFFKGIASNTSYDFDSSYLVAGVLRVEFEEQLNFGFLQGLQSRDPLLEGIKPGWTPKAGATGVYAKDSFAGTALGATFGRVIVDDDWVPYYDEAPVLMDIASSECGGSLARDGASPLAARLDDGFRVDWPELPTQVGRYSGGVTDLRGPTGGGRRYSQLDLLRPGGTGLTQCDLELDRGAEIAIPPAGGLVLGAAPFHAHGEIFMVNHGEAAVTILVTTPQSGTPIVHNLAPGDRAVIPPHSGPEEEYWQYQVANPSTVETVVLGLVENYSWSLTGLPGGMNPSFSAQILHDGAMHEQSLRLHLIGTDPVPGRSVYVALHDPGVVLDVTDDLIAPNGPARLLPAYPNPFGGATQIAFDLPKGGDLRLELFDVVGRRVRVLERAGAATGRGSFEWNGKSDDGREAAPGVYFYRLERNGHEEATGRVIRGK